ncbi:MAG: PBP1A family penicillin-binding protein [Actinomycetota bacterium]|nr:PBP1A family penicillin-binding protein [Actinomycetota bacterium]
MATIVKRRKLVVLFVLLALPALSGCSGVPKLEDALAHARAIAQSSKIFAADGTLLKTLHAEENRENIPLVDVPQHVRDAVIAIEDARFYKHSGLDARAILRAFVVNRSSGHVVEGGSTITQQYIKNALVSTERTLRRKLEEAALAYQLEQKYSKDEILELYLNTVYFGEGAYGIETAALTFFGVHAKRLDVPQGALLAGLIRSPVRYDPYVDPKIAIGRRNLVLQKMQEQGYLTMSAYSRAVRNKPRLRRLILEPKFPAPYFVTWVESLIQKDPQFAVLGKTQADRTNALFKGGLRIYTTVDLKLQKAAEEASRNILSYPGDPHNAFVGMDPSTGHVVAMVGGRDYFNVKDRYAKFNLATQARRQPGSSFKPFTLVAALEKGISLNKVYRGGSRVTIHIPGYETWSPRNYEGISFGALSLREGTVKSVNVVYAQVMQDVGPKAVVEVTKRMGITSTIRPFPSIALGTEGVSPLEMADAYSTLANGGYHVPVTPITKITDAKGNTVWQPKNLEKKLVVDPAIVALATDALSDVIKRGTGRKQQLGRPAGGKTGTSEEYHDAWFAGFTPHMVGISWVGFPQSESVSMRPPHTRITVFGGSWPGSIWKSFMMAAHEGLPIEQFPYDVKQVIRVRVDTTRNCIALEYPLSDVVVDRYYMRDRVPTESCTGGAPVVTGAAPDVVGKLQSVATELLHAAGFEVSARHIYCPTYPSGYVCRQSPSPGVAGTTSQAVIDVSDDSAVATVPMVLGETASRARSILESAGFTVSIQMVEKDDGYEGCRQDETRSGRVWLQLPCAGATAGAGSLVRVYVNP